MLLLHFSSFFLKLTQIQTCCWAAIWACSNCVCWLGWWWFDLDDFCLDDPETFPVCWEAAGSTLVPPPLLRWPDTFAGPSADCLEVEAWIGWGGLPKEAENCIYLDIYFWNIWMNEWVFQIPNKNIENVFFLNYKNYTMMTPQRCARVWVECCSLLAERTGDHFVRVVVLRMHWRDGVGLLVRAHRAWNIRIV